jgi:Arc/MetJ-type ribon-helix-helix transcriptional regulator
MKRKLSVSVEEKTVNEIEELIQSGKFRNKSHVIEFAVNSFINNSERKELNKNE